MAVYHAFQSHDVALKGVLERLVVDSSLHARFLNTLARVEYLGAQSHIEGVSLERLSKATLQLNVEGTRHAWMLKKLACRLDRMVADSFGHQATVSGDVWDQYRLAVSRDVEEVLGVDTVESHQSDGHRQVCAAWCLLHRMVELYRAYEPLLAASGIPNVVAVIIDDKHAHLETMASNLFATDASFARHFDTLRDREYSRFREVWSHIEACVEVAAA